MSEPVPAVDARTIWLQRVATVVVVAALVVLARQAATQSIDFPVYHRAAQQVRAGNYELYPPEAYGGQPHPSPVPRRCSSLTYAQYAHSSRLAARAPRGGIHCTYDEDRPLGR